MTRDEALQMLSAQSAHERLTAARFLARHSDPADALRLRDARKNETVSYVKDSLDLALSKSIEAIPKSASGDPPEIEIPEDARKRIRAQAIEWITGFVLHEVASQVGLIARAASQEIADYSNSTTKRHIQTLQQIFPAIEQLKGATASPRIEEFDLSELLTDIVAEETAGTTLAIAPQGARPLLIKSDRVLLRFAVRNGIRNAIEAVGANVTGDPHPVVLSYGETDKDYWIAVIDRGPGLVGPTESVFDIGRSRKTGHIGFGLAIARQAMETLGGSVTLEPAAGGGARFELRWER